MRLMAMSVLLLALGCTRTTEPLLDLTGQWAAPYTIPGSALDFTLSQVTDSLHGSGTYAIEAGRAGTLEVRGRYQRPSISLTLIYDFGPPLFFTGQVQGSRMAGIVTDSAGQHSPQTFIKR